MFPDQSRLQSPSFCALLVSGPLYKLRAGNTKAPVFMKCNHAIFLPLGLEVTAFHWFPLSFSSNAVKTLHVRHLENSLFQFPYMPTCVGCSHRLTHTYIHLHRKKEFKQRVNTWVHFTGLLCHRAKANLFGSSVVREDMRREDNSLH